MNLDLSFLASLGYPVYTKDPHLQAFQALELKWSAYALLAFVCVLRIRTPIYILSGQALYPLTYLHSLLILEFVSY